MRRSIVLILGLALIAAACGDGDDASATTTTAVATTAAETTTTAPSTTSESPTTEQTTTTAAETTTTAAETTTTPAPSGDAPPLVITSVDFDEERVEITNVSGAEYSLEGHFVCNFPTYSSVSDIGTVAPGESFTVELSVLSAGSNSGEIGLYTASDFGNPDAMVTYVEWGTPNHGRSNIAVSAGLWTAGDFVDNEGASFRAQTTGGSGTDYEIVQ